ncbi:MAG: crossover junction endodeoxyribonuclease RuvC [Bacillota bacterium]|nr:crossover junction endodeoxyribonuclease RuvC [Bacillota bacterium]
MVILGIDPGIAIIGTGVVNYEANKFKVLYYDAITTKAHTPIEERIHIVYEGIGQLMDTFKPDAISMEELYFNNNAKTAFAVGQARGVLLLAASQHHIPVFSYTPLQVKQAITGYGRADKNQVQQMVKSFLNLRAVPKPDDVADALAMAICHAHSYKFNSIFENIAGGANL